MSIQVVLREWESYGPGELASANFDDHPDARKLAAQLTQSGRLDVAELRTGIALAASSWVGQIRLGPLELTILPKVDFAMLRTLLSYAYGLRNLHLLDAVDHVPDVSTFQDLLISQLIGEVENLLARGIQRRYRAQEADLASPRGRIAVGHLARQGGLISATLPCHFYPRVEDTLLNRTLLAGLRAATGLTGDLALRTSLRRLAGRLESNVATLPLDATLLRRAARSVDRLAHTYRPALHLIELLYLGSGLSWDEPGTPRLRLPGYLFDMNIFFEALITRFLGEHLIGSTVVAQYTLRDMLRYLPGHNPRHRRAPTPRPDIALIQDGRLVALLDMKYRDLWEQPLPRDMLYQLTLYALSQAAQPAGTATATILYPTLATAAVPQIIAIQEPVHGAQQAQVILRPVHLPSLEAVLRASGTAGRRRCTELAHTLAWGAA